MFNFDNLVQTFPSLHDILRDPKSRAIVGGTVLLISPAVFAAGYISQPIPKGCGGSPPILYDLLLDKELMRRGDAWVVDQHFWALPEVRPEHVGMQIRDVPKAEHRAEYYPLWEEVAGDTMHCTEAMLQAYGKRTPTWLLEVYPHQLDARIAKVRSIQIYLQNYEEKWGVNLRATDE